jgi:hypothetical protein
MTSQNSSLGMLALLHIFQFADCFVEPIASTKQAGLDSSDCREFPLLAVLCIIALWCWSMMSLQLGRLLQPQQGNWCVVAQTG